ncbi:MULTISPECIES: hypothetical protein [unclassified Corynebacterium]|uniref:hypothetical protein n=1 Tax=unclassified Corynebacterium TaxID=2624378 RepID=UPI0021685E61|nr:MULTISPECIES: hypothetical protein [unclassified Corynebacterium]MCS4490356.1 hypothetical protein [Corynebacterium sp. ES2775-CONJ]MCS4492134.1 hypothetical protein [Corynebacterium sp. ES2715-CONJ3]
MVAIIQALAGIILAIIIGLAGFSSSGELKSSERFTPNDAVAPNWEVNLPHTAHPVTPEQLDQVRRGTWYLDITGDTSEYYLQFGEYFKDLSEDAKPFPTADLPGDTQFIDYPYDCNASTRWAHFQEDRLIALGAFSTRVGCPAFTYGQLIARYMEQGPRAYLDAEGRLYLAVDGKALAYRR